MYYVDFSTIKIMQETRCTILDDDKANKLAEKWNVAFVPKYIGNEKDTVYTDTLLLFLILN